MLWVVCFCVNPPPHPPVQVLAFSPPFSHIAHLTTLREGGHGATWEELAQLAPESLGQCHHHPVQPWAGLLPLRTLVLAAK